MKADNKPNLENKPDMQNYMGKIIAVIDDEPDILELVSINLKKAGFRTKEFLSITPFFDYLRKETPYLIVLDLMLPDSDGFEVCKTLKKYDDYSRIPIIMLTARAAEMDKILGLEIGADDYITKPFSPRELVARIKGILRRDDKNVQQDLFRVGDLLSIDFNKFEVLVNNIKTELTTTEFRILKLLVERKGWVYSRAQIIDYLDTKDKGVLDRTVDVHIKNLREKLGEAGKCIKNIRGIGYKFEEQ